jgi:hypothetical protein
MKKLLLFFIFVLLLSCEKQTYEKDLSPDPEQTFCWKCVVTTKYTATRFIPVTKIDTVIKCDFTEREMMFYIDIKSELVKLITDGWSDVLTAKSDYDCKKQ